MLSHTWYKHAPTCVLHFRRRRGVECARWVSRTHCSQAGSLRWRVQIQGSPPRAVPTGELMLEPLLRSCTLIDDTVVCGHVWRAPRAAAVLCQPGSSCYATVAGVHGGCEAGRHKGAGPHRARCRSRAHVWSQPCMSILCFCLLLFASPHASSFVASMMLPSSFTPTMRPARCEHVTGHSTDSGWTELLEWFLVRVRR